MPFAIQMSIKCLRAKCVSAHVTCKIPDTRIFCCSSWSFEEKTLTWSKPYIRKLVFLQFWHAFSLKCMHFMQIRWKCVHFQENACILCKLDENAHIFRKCMHFMQIRWKCAHFLKIGAFSWKCGKMRAFQRKTLPSRVTFIFFYWSLLPHSTKNTA